MSVHLVNDFFRIVTLLEARHDQEATFDFAVITINGNTIRSASGALITPDGKLNNEHYDIIVVPPFEGRLLSNMPRDTEHISRWLCPYWASNTTVITLSTAAYFWAKHRSIQKSLTSITEVCATHWAFVKPLSRQFPNMLFSYTHAYRKIRNIYSTSTFEAGIDVLLSVVAKVKGDVFAQQCAASLLVDKPIKMAPLLPQYRLHNDERIAVIQQWIDDHSSPPLSLNDLSNRFTMSERNLKRRFSSATGISVTQYIQAVRIDKAKKLLISTDRSVKEIALEVGYENDGFFTRLFKKNHRQHAS
ncbi:GlxA family transcriptional regulator [Alteromonas sp. KUL17]|uniref:GlxA family transcriptional regulator n=1 Tax=Alteromonas sp. KUL17 TaxID=2480796 RepID=UPI001F5F1966|nr:helix-turn-helix domain-containing protein [Alteromonas sp. KUL17]